MSSSTSSEQSSAVTLLSSKSEEGEKEEEFFSSSSPSDVDSIILFKVLLMIGYVLMVLLQNIFLILLNYINQVEI